LCNVATDKFDIGRIAPFTTLINYLYKSFGKTVAWQIKKTTFGKSFSVKPNHLLFRSSLEVNVGN
jgi:hypothetical protein